MSVWLAILAAWAVMAVLMALLWLLQCRTGDAGIVDVAWGLGVGLIAVGFAFVGTGDVVRRGVVAGLAAVWALRLSGYILQRVFTMPEDGRYSTLRESWGPHTQRNLFLFFQLQAFWAVLFALPMLLAFGNPHAFPSAFDVAGLAIWVIAIAGEAIADRQLHRFRSDPANKGQVCRDGLWRYSRHPNYFFEWCHWWAYALFAIAAPWGLLAVLGPLGMLYFLTRVTGIPPTEAQALKSRGDAYREYQRTTSPFVPWPPKPSAPAG